MCGRRFARVDSEVGSWPGSEAARWQCVPQPPLPAHSAAFPLYCSSLCCSQGLPFLSVAAPRDQRLRAAYSGPRAGPGVVPGGAGTVGPSWEGDSGVPLDTRGSPYLGPDGLGTPGAGEGRATPRAAPEPERVHDEVEKLLALVRVKRAQT